MVMDMGAGGASKRSSTAVNQEQLDALKSLIIDQEVLLATYTDSWELLYLDLASCVKIMINMERKSESKGQEEMKTNLDKAKNELSERKAQNQALQEKLEAIQESCNQLNLMHKRDVDSLKKAQE